MSRMVVPNGQHVPDEPVEAATRLTFAEVQQRIAVREPVDLEPGDAARALHAARSEREEQLLHIHG